MSIQSLCNGEGAVRPVSFCLAGLLVLSLTGAGCQTSPPNRAEQLSFSIKDVRRVAAQSQEHTRAAVASLRELAEQPEGDLRPGFDKFADRRKKLDALSLEMARESRQMQSKGADYFTSWQKDIEQTKSPEFRERSVKRREQAMQNFQTLNGSLQTTVDAFTPFLKRLRDTESLLSHDLNRQGSTSLQELSAAAEGEAGAVLAKLDALIADLDRVAADFAPVKVNDTPAS